MAHTHGTRWAAACPHREPTRALTCAATSGVGLLSSRASCAGVGRWGGVAKGWKQAGA